MLSKKMSSSRTNILGPNVDEKPQLISPLKVDDDALYEDLDGADQ